jgi:hypothetical protein
LHRIASAVLELAGSAPAGRAQTDGRGTTIARRCAARAILTVYGIACGDLGLAGGRFFKVYGIACWDV